ncbi:hypothetical protein [Marinigracilibium pacificum]|uniref:Uncharacterized protein n=1 Tax=Marinigracilibium pacificum TaxID=2729599 RepID=A0A848IXG1_9BACT|nr:hypothetical protein [Marinigracilibium pacificum]NMM46934.1 hypothetical protein [Marinigracilibium pacificum]
MKHINRHLLTIFFCLISYLSFSQINNQAFIRPGDSLDSISGKFYLNLNSNAYFKNNEYFGEIVEGYTLFGYNMVLSAGYGFNENFTVEAGAFARWDFGKQDYNKLLPYFRIDYHKNKDQLLFGNINGWLAHNYFEPMYEFENFMTNTPELGIQYLRRGKWYDLDVWVDWQNMIYPGDSTKEEIAGGLVFDNRIINNNSITIGVPFQFKVYHRGGQIDVSQASLITRTNIAIGPKINFKLSDESVVKNLEGSFYWLNFNDGSGTQLLPFSKGTGIMANALIHFKNKSQLLLSYWDSSDYYSYQGGRLYQSMSTEYGNGAYQENRQLLFLRYTYDLTVADDSYLTFRAEPFYDFQNSSLDYSFAVYFNVNLTYPISK